MIRIRCEVTPLVGFVAALAIGLGLFLKASLPALGIFSLGTACLLFFFRNPERIPHCDPTAILSGADDRIISVTRLRENWHFNTDCIRISTFLSLFDVHIAQIAGVITRRVVYWLNQKIPLSVRAGERIGLMKFGSHLDIDLPNSDVEVLIRSGDKVRASDTMIARIKTSHHC